MVKSHRHRFRLTDEALYDIIFLTMAGFSNRQISVRLNLPQQTVSRNVNVIRKLLFESDSFVDLVKQFYWVDLPEIEKFYLFPEAFAINNIFWHLSQDEDHRKGFSNALFSCLLHCPTMPDFQEIKSKHLRVRLLVGHFIYPTHTSLENYRKLNDRVHRRNDCSACPITVSRTTKRNGERKTLTRTYTIKRITQIFGCQLHITSSSTGGRTKKIS